MCSPDRPFQPYGSETRGQKTQGSERRYKEIPKITRADMSQDVEKVWAHTPGVETPLTPDEPDDSTPVMGWKGLW